jgi:hypothetical protein
MNTRGLAPLALLALLSLCGSACAQQAACPIKPESTELDFAPLAAACGAHVLLSRAAGVGNAHHHGRLGHRGPAARSFRR